MGPVHPSPEFDYEMNDDRDPGSKNASEEKHGESKQYITD